MSDNYNGMHDALLQLFADDNKLKKLMTEVWDKEQDSLISNVYKEDEFDNHLGIILEKEQRFTQLCDRPLIMHSNPITAILTFKKHFKYKQRSALSMRMEHFIKRPLSFSLG